MSGVDDIRNGLSSTREQAALVTARLVQAQQELQQIQGLIAQITSGSTNDTAQQALATYALAAANVQDVINAIFAADDLVGTYYHQL